MMKRIGLGTVGFTLLVVGCNSDTESIGTGPGNDAGNAGLPSTVAGSSGDGPAGAAGDGGSDTAVGGATGGSGCVVQQAVGDDPLIDDLEDGDDKIREADGRRGTWYLRNDETIGGTQNDTGEFSPDSSGANGSDYSARTWGDGFNTWGASLGVQLNAPTDDQACPYDASAYLGIQFYARGSGLLRVSVDTSSTLRAGVDASSDWYQAEVRLNDGWTRYQIPWRQLLGAVAQFPINPTGLVDIEFSAGPGGPFDFQIDDVSFIGADEDPGDDALSLPDVCVAEHRTAEGSGLLIDDLEDGDVGIEAIDGRRGFWWATTTEGEVQAISFLEPFHEGANGTEWSARSWGQGVDGAGIGVAINTPQLALGCGYDACRYEGVSFYLKGSTGSNRVLFRVQTTPNTPTVSGGTCDEDCYDDYRTQYALTDTWTYHELAWDDPGLYTLESNDPLAVSQILGFSVTVDGLQGNPFEISMDELRFYGTGTCAGGGAGHPIRSLLGQQCGHRFRFG